MFDSDPSPRSDITLWKYFREIANMKYFIFSTFCEYMDGLNDYAFLAIDCTHPCFQP